MFFSREQAGACEGPSAVSEGLSAVPNRLASLKSKTGGTIPPRSPIRNLRICSKFFSAAIFVEVRNQNSAENQTSHRGCMFAALDAVTTATLTHLMGCTHPAPRQRSVNGHHPNIDVVVSYRSWIWATACTRVAKLELFFEVAARPNTMMGQKQRTSASACARRRSSTAVLACSVDRNCPPRFPGTCAILNTVSAATYRS
jgi:hypothetical protein